MKVRLWVGGMVVAVGLGSSPALAQERLVHHEVDRNTNAVVRVFKTSSGGRIEVETPDLRIAKSVSGSRVVTTMSEGKKRLVLTADERSLSAATEGQSVTTPRSDRQRLEKLRALVAGSAVGRRAAALIGQLGFGRATPVQPMLLATRAFLLAAMGEGSGQREMSRWAREAARRVGAPAGVIAVAWQEKSKGMTPTECWEAYAKEAIAAVIELEDCMEDVSWWEFLDSAACSVIYDMRAIGAFQWWLRCVSLG